MAEQRKMLGHVRIGKSERRGEVRRANDRIESTHKRRVQKKTELLLKKLYCSFYSIFSTVPFKVVPSAGDTPFLTFLPLLECFLERTFCDSAQFSYLIFLNLLYGLETTSFQSGFEFGKQENVCWV